MNRKISAGRKLSVDMHRKLSAISNCSDISNLSFKLGMDPDDFKSTVQNILGLKKCQNVFAKLTNLHDYLRNKIKKNC